MSIFAISDLHLSLGCDKPMDIFGSRWINYTDRMCRNWNKVVRDEDYVIIPGDISWATYIEDSVADFDYINNLKGRKVLLKGNHDYWWTTSSKMRKFFDANKFDTIDFIQNDAYIMESGGRRIAVCGSRGWVTPSPNSDGENRKIYEREKQRFLLSVQAAERAHPDEIIGAMHYPPLEQGKEGSPFLDIMRQYNIKLCIYGHLHAASHMSAPKGVFGGVDLKLVSCDYLDFLPKLIMK